MKTEEIQTKKAIEDVNPDDVKKLVGLIITALPVVIKIIKDLKK